MDLLNIIKQNKKNNKLITKNSFLYIIILSVFNKIKINWFLLIKILVSIFLFTFTLTVIWNNIEIYLINRLYNIWLQLTIQISNSIIFINVLALLWRGYLVITYRSIPICSIKNLPSITVIIPAYNEGKHIATTMYSVAASNYPINKLQIIVVDDGSQDDTWLYMQQANIKLGNRCKLIQQPYNLGKRHALYGGFSKATGDYLITIDSDSVIEKHTLATLISPMINNSIVGAVAGNVRVLNIKAGIIPKMMEVAFTFSFDFLRRAHSRINTVMCTPGALSAYRKSAVLPILEKWLNETFLGKPYRIGEDRYLTNLILEQGYHILFQSNATVYTNVPINYKGLVKMLIRWSRSDIRESLYMNKFIFKKFRQSSTIGARINYIISWIDMLLGQIVIVNSIFYLFKYQSIVFIYYSIIGIIIAGLIPMIAYFIRYHSLICLWAIPYSIYYIISLAWIPIWAIFTLHKCNWLTRKLKTQVHYRPWHFKIRQITHKYTIVGMIFIAFLTSGISFYLNQALKIPLSHYLDSSSKNFNNSPPQSNNRLKYIYSESGLPKWQLSAHHSSSDNQEGLINLQEVELVIFQKDGSELKFRSDRAEYDSSEQLVTLRGNVYGTTAQGLTLTTNSLNFSKEEKLVNTDDEILLSAPNFKARGKGIIMDIMKNRTTLKKISTSSISIFLGNYMCLPSFLDS